VNVFDLAGVSSLCDYFVIVSGTSMRQLNAFAQAIQEDLEKDRIKPLHRPEANDESGWIALDFASVVVHIFYKPLREFYALERLWSDAKRVRIPGPRTRKQK
jgi:ribosome-associated protein